MIETITLSLSFVGLAFLALAMRRHHQQVWGRAPSRRVRLLLHLIGTVGLSASLVACIASAGWAIGPVLWFGLLSAASLVVVLLLTYRLRIAALAAFVIPIARSDIRNH